MNKNYTAGHPLVLLKAALDILKSNPVIFYPFCLLGFIQFFVLEILYFSPRNPLSQFFSPLVTRLWSEKFLHYPLNLELLPKLFYYAQIVIYLFLGSFLLAVSVRIITNINQKHKTSFQLAWRECLPWYIHIVLASLISFALFFYFTQLYSHLIRHALHKRNLIIAAPYAQFFFGILLTTLLIYLIPIIIIGKKKIWSALILNFKTLFSSFWLTLFVVFLPTLFYFPIVILRNNIESLVNLYVPEVQLVVLVVSVFISLLIDGLITTAITMQYLSKTEVS